MTHIFGRGLLDSSTCVEIENDIRPLAVSHLQCLAACFLLGLNSAMYSHSDDFLLDAFAKAYASAIANGVAATTLADQGHHAQAASLAVLSLEEVGKMMLLDGLLFARTGDDRYKRWKKGHLTHREKLDAVELYPMFLHYLTTTDARSGEAHYQQTMLIMQAELYERRQTLVDLFSPEFSLSSLDAVKQKGFYSHVVNGELRSNVDGVEPEVSQAVVALAWRVADTLRFVLEESLDNYGKLVRSVRNKSDDSTLKGVRRSAKEIVEKLFRADLVEP